MIDFETSDIVLAAYLKSEGMHLSRIDITGNKGIFVFEGVDSDLIDKYDLGQCRVEPVAFNNNIKQLTTSVRRMTQKR